jgi:hypothetical protein
MGWPLETSIFKFRLDQKSQRSLHFFLAAELNGGSRYEKPREGTFTLLSKHSEGE